MMRGMYSMDRVMDTEFRGDHSGSDPFNHDLEKFPDLRFLLKNYGCPRFWVFVKQNRFLKFIEF